MIIGLVGTTIAPWMQFYQQASVVEKGVTDYLKTEALAQPEVVALRDPETLEPISEIGEKPVLLLLFVRFGTTKLLDNRVIAPKSALFARVA